MTIPKRPEPMPDEICLSDDIWPEIFDTVRFVATIDLAAHEHAVAKVAVEALKAARFVLAVVPEHMKSEHEYGDEIREVDEALAAIEQSGWKPE